MTSGWTQVTLPGKGGVVNYPDGCRLQLPKGAQRVRVSVVVSVFDTEDGPRYAHHAARLELDRKLRDEGLMRLTPIVERDRQHVGYTLRDASCYAIPEELCPFVSPE